MILDDDDEDDDDEDEDDDNFNSLQTTVSQSSQVSLSQSNMH